MISVAPPFVVNDYLCIRNIKSMTNYNNNDLFQILLHRLRKDRKGGINAEEFESFLRNRNIDYFNKQMGVEGVSKLNQNSLAPFFVAMELTRDYTTADGIEIAVMSSTNIGLGAGLSYEVATLANVWAIAAAGGIVFTNRFPVDLVSSTEYYDRYTNSQTKGTTTEPIAYQAWYNLFLAPDFFNVPVLFLQGIPTDDYGVYVDYYRHPSDPYFDYYTDASGNITYLTEDQAAYTLQAGEVSRVD